MNWQSVLPFVDSSIPQHLHPGDLELEPDMKEVS